jgi:hypothetical protein
MSHSLPTRRQALAACFVAALTVAACAGLLGAAVAAHAPVAVVPLLTVVCVGCPIAATWPLPTSIAVLRTTGSLSESRLDPKALRRHLDRLPETEHPLGF